jgi:ribonuclease BN (tRNA processing enzyme)
LLEADGFRLMIDAGNGTTGTLQQYVGLLDLDAVVLSHLHGDHFVDLITYTYARRYHPDGRVPPLPVYGPSDTEQHLLGAFGRPVDELLAETFDFRQLTEGRHPIGPFSIETRHVNHPVETFGMRIENGRATLAYSADSGECEELVKLATGVDLFLCEASYLDGEENPPGLHLTGSEAGAYAERAGAAKLVLTHLVPWGDQERTLSAAHDAFAGDIELARTGTSFEL